ncbi:DUF3124 domain-containing protein [Microvirga massiliensis]|uniref:DUF3124 domain-containing protein n=1 Tax=Microvirga massiliensis TaxID=1033741 RepID=UPI00069B0FE4|nr:DUF3124 domain-containing protein [Microvirga massiliensis]
MSPHRNLAHIVTALVFLSGAAGPKPAVAQTAADYSSAFTGPLTEVPPVHRLSQPRKVYVPAYSAIRLASGRTKLNLAMTLSIHNLSEERRLIILQTDYFDTSGKLLQRYVPEPIAVGPLGTVEAFVPVEDTRGGTGANFVVEWDAEEAIPEPLVEAVMIGLEGTHSYSFVSRGKAMITPSR